MFIIIIKFSTYMDNIKYHVTLKNEVMAAQNSQNPHMNKLYFKIYSNRKQFY